MKKLVTLLLAVCVILGCVVGYYTDALHPYSSLAQKIENHKLSAAAGNGVIRTLNYKAIYRLHDPDEIVGSVDGRDVTWDEYFYWLHSEGSYIQSYLQMLALYGQSLNWNDKISADSDLTLIGYVDEVARSYVVQLNTIETVAEECGAVLTPEDEAELAKLKQERIVSTCGEGATEADYNALLKSEYTSAAMLDRMDRFEYLLRNAFSARFGEKGEKVTEEEALAYLKDKEYMSATHILFSTYDKTAGQKLDEKTVAEKRAQAEAVAAELRAIADPRARAARFAELKKEYCEDTGKEQYPDGYLFVSGKMVTEFENAVKALEEYEVSEVVESTYGFHVIMRLPLSVTMAIDYADDGTAKDARYMCASEQFNELLSSRIEAASFVPADGFSIDLSKYLK